MLPVGQKTMLALASLAGVMTIGTLVYMLVAQPASLHRTRDGVAYFTPPVISPIDGRALNVERLAAYYKGNIAAGRRAVETRPVATGNRH